MFSGKFVAACALAVALTGIVASPAGARTSASTSQWGTSFVDKDNNGVRSAGDLDFATEIARFGAYYLHTSGDPWGLVLENVALKDTAPTYVVQVNGNISVRGSYTMSGEGVVTFTSTVGNVDIAAGMNFAGKGSLTLLAPKGNMNIGAKAQISGGGDAATTALYGWSTTVGDNVKFSVGSGYHTMSVRALGTQLTFGKNVTATGPAHGKFALLSDGNVELHNLNVKMGYIDITSGHDGINTYLHIYDSTFNQSYKNGALRFIASHTGGAWPAGSMILQNTTITSAGHSVLLQPNPS